MSNVIAVIPARFGAQRFPGKPLVPLLNKPMIQWVIEGVSQSRKVSTIIVATDSEKIAEVALKSGVEVAMTDSDLPTGSDRVWQAVKDRKEDLILNVQGDEPLIQGPLIDSMIDSMTSNDDWEMLTLGRAMNQESLSSPNTAKIVLNHKNQAIYFSRFPIPYSRHDSNNDFSSCLKHIGIYGYKKSFLEKFCAQAPTDIERYEGLEQLRALYLGARINVVPVDYESWGVDTPDDIPKVEKKLRILYGQEKK